MLECLSCNKEFLRQDAPDLHCCEQCVPDPKNIDENRCPKCGWDSYSFAYPPDDTTTYEQTDITMHWEYGYCGGMNWIDHWTCPHCKTEFSYPNSNV